MVSKAIAARFQGLDDEGDSNLHIAAYNGYTEEVKKILEEQADQSQKNRRNRFGCTPLRLAASAGKVDCVRVLLEARVDTDICDVKAQTPLFSAVKDSRPDCVEELLKHGACAEGSQDNIASPMYVATIQGWYEGVKLLLDYGADIHANCHSLRTSISVSVTPLQLAIAYRHYNIAKLLMEVDPVSVPLSVCNVIQILCEIVLHHHSGVQFLNLLYHALGEVHFPDNCDECLQAVRVDSDIGVFFSITKSTPCSLKSLCRLVIRRHITRCSLQILKSLEIPQSLIPFLMLDEL